MRRVALRTNEMRTSTCSQNMVNMTEISSYITRTHPLGDKYAVSITTGSITTGSVPLDTRTPPIGANHTQGFVKLLRGATTAYVPSDPLGLASDDHHGVVSNGDKVYEEPQAAELYLPGTRTLN